jgi:serine acetyltransferase
MADQQRKLEIAPDQKSKRDYADPSSSDRGGVGGIFETIIRKFKNLSHIFMIVPVYGIGCLTIGVALAPGIALFEFITSFAAGLPDWQRYILTGFAAGAAYFTYGFTLLLVVPFVNFVMMAKLKPFRGPYYSLEAIRWYIHNGATYLARYTFLEFATPTPMSLAFYRMMGMKIGRGTVLNTTWISDPSLIELGEKVTIGGSVTMVAHYGQGGYLVLAPVKIGDKVTIGLKATVMGGVTIGAGAKIMPHSVVMPKTEIPAGETWGGVPARKMDT